MNILVIRDNKPGHYNQTEGLLLSLKELYPKCNISYSQVEIKNKLSRKILRFLLNNFSKIFTKISNLKYVKYFYKDFDLPNIIPDIIISTGGNTANINAWLTLAYKNKNILNGALRGLKENLFTGVSTVIDLGYKNQILMDTAPNILTKELLIKESEIFFQKIQLNRDKEYYALLIGGNGSGYRYNNDFYDNLIRLVKNISVQNNITWLITTSRRTPLEIEKKLKLELEKISAFFVDYNKNPQKVIIPFLGIGSIIFVTEESSSMISEAISANKPVYTIGYKKSNPNKNYLAILSKYENSNKIERIQCEEKVIFTNNFQISKNDNYKKNSILLKNILAKNHL